MGQTTNLHLKKPEYSDPGDIKDINDNMDTIDSAIKTDRDNISAIQAWQPSGNGTQDQILRTNGDGTTRWDAAATQDEIIAATEGWLADHINTNEFGVDDTLLIAGDAADSKVTGEKISELKSALNADTESLNRTEISIEWNQGSIASNGKNSNNDKAVRTDMISFSGYVAVQFDNAEFLYYVVEYHGNSINDFEQILYPAYSSGICVFEPVNGYYYRFCVKRSSGTDLAPTDSDLAHIKLYGIKPVSELLDSAVSNKGVITDGAGLDLNTGDFIKPGMWMFNISDMTPEGGHVPENYPSSYTGRLISFATTSSSSFSVFQLFVDNQNRVYERWSSSNGTWRTWREVANMDDLETSIGSLKDDSLVSIGNITTTGLDMDTGDFIHPGMWSLSDIQYKPTNYPPTNSIGRIVSFASSSDSTFGVGQMVITGTELFVRFSTSDGNFSTWKKTILDTDIGDFVMNKGNIATTGLDLNTGDFIHPGIWFVNNTTYLPKNCPANKICRIISFASSSNNTIGTFQIVAERNGNLFWRYSPQTSEWTAWHCETIYHAQAFQTLWTNPQPFVNNYTIQKHSKSEENKVAKMYALYDGVTVPTGMTVTKDDLGTDESGDFHIYNYKVSLDTGDKPAVLLIVGEHGDEMNSAMLGYYTYREIVNGVLTKYLKYVDFWVIPLMNPWGYENASRNNSNDVNPNRDFPCEWQYSYSEGGHNNTGNYSLSQKETQIVYNLLVTNKDKILFICNKHDTGSIAKKFATSQEDKVAYTSTYLQTDAIVNEGVTEYQNQQIRETDGWLISECQQDVSDYRLVASRKVNTSGSLDLFANSIGIHGSLLEVCAAATESSYPGYYSDGHTGDLARLGLDFFVNWITATIENNDKILTNDNTFGLLRYYTRKQNASQEWVSVEQYWNGSTLVDITDVT